MVWLFLNCLFGERIITLRNGGTPMILKSFLLPTDMKSKDFLKLYHHISLKVQSPRMISQNLEHLLVPLCHQPQSLSFLLQNELKFGNLETLMPPGSLLFLTILVKEDLQHYSMMRKIIMIL